MITTNEMTDKQLIGKIEDEEFERIAQLSQATAPGTPSGWTRHADGKVSPPPGIIFTAQGD